MNSTELRKQYDTIVARQWKGKQYKEDQLQAHKVGRIDKDTFNKNMNIAHTLMRKLEEERKYLRKILISKGEM